MKKIELEVLKTMPHYKNRTWVDDVEDNLLDVSKTTYPDTLIEALIYHQSWKAMEVALDQMHVPTDNLNLQERISYYELFVKKTNV